MTEFKETVRLALKLLDEPNADPDDDLRMLSRQFLRQIEITEKLKHDACDPAADLINANRDSILRKHEEAIRLIREQAMGNLHQIQRIIAALGMYHPMYEDSWSGWPEGG